MFGASSIVQVSATTKQKFSHYELDTSIYKNLLTKLNQRMCKQNKNE